MEDQAVIWRGQVGLRRTLLSEEGLFASGSIEATKDAGEALIEAGVAGFMLVERHLHGDWGDISPEGREENERAIQSRGRIISSYKLGAGLRVWVLTEADRSKTTILLPEEYPLEGG